MLHDSNVRIASADEITSRQIVHLRWAGNDPRFVPSSHYRLLSTAVMDKQMIETYELIEE